MLNCARPGQSWPRWPGRLGATLVAERPPPRMRLKNRGSSDSLYCDDNIIWSPMCEAIEKAKGPFHQLF